MAQLIKVNGETEEFPNAELETLQKAVGYIQLVPLGNGRNLAVNEDGQALRLNPNPKATALAKQLIVGDVVLLEKGEFEGGIMKVIRYRLDIEMPDEMAVDDIEHIENALNENGMAIMRSDCEGEASDLPPFWGTSEFDGKEFESKTACIAHEKKLSDIP